MTGSLSGVTLDPKDPTPLHAQLERSIRVAIATGRLAEGNRLPTVRELAVHLRINANTVAKVYAHLERDGALETRRGAGTFVAATAGTSAREEVHAAERRALALRVIADAARHGFTVDELLDAIASVAKEHGREKRVEEE